MAVRIPRGMKLVNLLLGSWTSLILLFLYLPILILIVYSFNTSRSNIRWEGFTFEWYSNIGLQWYAPAMSWFAKSCLWYVHLANDPGDLAPIPPLIAALNNSLLIAAVTTVFSVFLGTIGAWLLYRYRFPFPRLTNTLIFIPMVIPEIIMGVSLLIFFATVNTWGNGMLAKLGVSDSNPMSLGLTTVIISHVTFCFPFVLIAVQARLAGVDPALEEAAMDLGATPMKAFFYVMVPYLLPAIISGALMSFTLSMDELIVTYFTSSARSQTLPMVIFGRVKKGLDPSLNAISALFIVSTALLVVVAESVKKWNK